MAGKFRRLGRKLWWSYAVVIIVLIPIGGAIRNSGHPWQVGYACFASLLLGARLGDWANSDDKDEEAGEGEGEEDAAKPNEEAEAAADGTR
ncbi:hypothetical protein [Actinacidiphila acididurans]|uniref:Uncharacterized protein n=1 Tax=Actinacidiphila acididurans TaxID=2784346 RepID=A0ABS2U4F2_9ACTN|nr:hypothetical protein [Actinacidiphila acididurans]MBM9509018.1 hypothetical protein [Actinacidiphila acididurans]